MSSNVDEDHPRRASLNEAVQLGSGLEESPSKSRTPCGFPGGHVTSQPGLIRTRGVLPKKPPHVVGGPSNRSRRAPQEVPHRPRNGCPNPGCHTHRQFQRPPSTWRDKGGSSPVSQDGSHSDVCSAIMAIAFSDHVRKECRRPQYSDPRLDPNVKTSRTLCLAATPIRFASLGCSSSQRIFARRAPASFGGTTKPVSPSTTTSGKLQTSVTMAGAPQANAFEDDETEQFRDVVPLAEDGRVNTG